MSGSRISSRVPVIGSLARPGRVTSGTRGQPDHRGAAASPRTPRRALPARLLQRRELLRVPDTGLEVAEALHETDPDISFSFGTRVNQILKAADVLPRLRECGLRFIELGIESASEPVLPRLAKHVTPDVNVAAVRLLGRLDIEISLDFIMLDPASTLDDVWANIEFLRDNGFYDYVLPRLGAVRLPAGLCAVPLVRPTPIRTILAVIRDAVAATPPVLAALDALREVASPALVPAGAVRRG